MAALTSNIYKPTIPWWLILIQGIIALVLGVLLLLEPQATLLVLIQVLGIWWLVTGILDIVSLFLDRTGWGWKLFRGIVGIIAGLLILQHPLVSAVFVPSLIVIFLGFLGIVQGIMGIIGAFRGGGWVSAVFGVVSIIVGLILLANTLVAAVVALPLIIGIFAVVAGGIGVWQSLQIKKAQGV